VRVTVERCDEVPETIWNVGKASTTKRGILIISDDAGDAFAWYGPGAWTKVSFDYGDD